MIFPNNNSNSFFKSKRAQQAIEYLTLFGIIAIILVVAVLIFNQYSSTTKDDITLETTEGTLNILVKEAERVYFIGRGSENIIKINIPAYIKEIKTCNDPSDPTKPGNPDNCRELTAVVILKNGEMDLTVASRAPIYADIKTESSGTKNILIKYTNIGNNIYGIKLEEKAD